MSDTGLLFSMDDPRLLPLSRFFPDAKESSIKTLFSPTRGAILIPVVAVIYK
jgi:hypothetical protein